MSPTYLIPGGPGVCLLGKHRCVYQLVCTVQKTLINRICHSQDQKKRKKQQIARSCQQCPAFYIITMFIGFLFSQWQRGHLPTAALQSGSKISCETYWGADQSALTPPIKLQFKKTQCQAQLYNRYIFQQISSIFFLFCAQIFSLGWKMLP